MVDRKKEAARLAKRVGKNIAEQRKTLGWTQDQLAERVNVDAQTVSRFERGANLPSLLTLVGLAESLRVSPGDLLSGAGQPESGAVAVCETWLAELSEADRIFVLGIVANCCEHLRRR